MMRIDSGMLAAAPIDMLGAAQPHTTYTFANLRASRCEPHRAAGLSH